MLPRVLILHGWKGSGPDHWQTWLAARLSERGAHVQYPDLPLCDEPCPNRWGAALQREARRLSLSPGDGERVVVAHSLGCVLWLRESPRLAPEYRPDRVALVAPPCPHAGVPELEDFYPTGADADSVAAAAGSTVLVCADDDPYCPDGGAHRYWAGPLGLPVELVPGGAHLNTDAGYGPWPEIEAWCLGERPAVGAAPASSGPHR